MSLRYQSSKAKQTIGPASLLALNVLKPDHCREALLVPQPGSTAQHDPFVLLTSQHVFTTVCSYVPQMQDCSSHKYFILLSFDALKQQVLLFYSYPLPRSTATQRLDMYIQYVYIYTTIVVSVNFVDLVDQEIFGCHSKNSQPNICQGWLCR